MREPHPLSFSEALAALHALLGEYVDVEIEARSGLPVASLRGTLARAREMLTDNVWLFVFAEYGRDVGFWLDPDPELFERAEGFEDGEVRVYLFGGGVLSVQRHVDIG